MNYKQTIKERVSELFKNHVEITDTNIVFNDTMGFKQELHEAYTSNFIEMIDEEIEKQKSFITGDIDDTNNIITVSLIGHYGILKSKLMEGK